MKIKIVVRKSGLPSDLARSMTWSALEFAKDYISKHSLIAVDRGHKHSDASYEVCVWLSQLCSERAVEFVPISTVFESAAVHDSTLLRSTIDATSAVLAANLKNTETAAQDAFIEMDEVDKEQKEIDDDAACGKSNQSTNVRADNYAYSDGSHFEDNLVASLSRSTGELRKRKGRIDELQAMWDSVPVAAHSDPAASAVRADLLFKIDEQSKLEAKLKVELIDIVDHHCALMGIEHGSRKALAMHESVRRRCLADVDSI